MWPFKPDPLPAIMETQTALLACIYAEKTQLPEMRAEIEKLNTSLQFKQEHIDDLEDRNEQLENLDIELTKAKVLGNANLIKDNAINAFLCEMVATVEIIYPQMASNSMEKLSEMVVDKLSGGYRSSMDKQKLALAAKQTLLMYQATLEAFQ